ITERRVLTSSILRRRGAVAPQLPPATHTADTSRCQRGSWVCATRAVAVHADAPSGSLRTSDAPVTAPWMAAPPDRTRVPTGQVPPTEPWTTSVPLLWVGFTLPAGAPR